MRAKTNASGNQRSVQSEIARPSRIAAGSRGRFTADGSTTCGSPSGHVLRNELPDPIYRARLAARRARRSAASPLSSECVQRAERVLVSARDACVPPGHVPKILQAGGIAAGAEPQQRRAGVGQLTRESNSRFAVEPRIVRLIYPVVSPDAPVGREVVARLRPRAPAPNLRLKLRDHPELGSQPLPVVEAAVQGEAADRDVLARLHAPVRDVRARDARAVYVLPVDVIRDEAVPVHVLEFPRRVEPCLDLRQPRRLTAADDVVRVPGRRSKPRTLQGRDLELELERVG